MNRVLKILNGAIAILLLPQVAHANGQDLSNIFTDIIVAFTPVWVPVGVFVLVIAGFTLVLSQDESKLAKARATIGAVIGGGVAILLTPAIIPLVYTGTYGLLAPATTDQFNAEALGLAEWISSFAGMAAFLVIVLSAINAVVAGGSDESKYQAVRTAIVHAIIGLVFLTINAFVYSWIRGGTPNPLIDFLLLKVELILELITTVAVAVMVYAGFKMVTNFGNEEAFTQGKNLAIRVALGLFVILVSYTLVYVITTLFSLSA